MESYSGRGRGGGKNRGGRVEKREVVISKTLSWILRHSA
jgi:RNA:NAD 2'-phosphotransferase (TPT1/KptA family)